jgi:hypothetical protein
MISDSMKYANDITPSDTMKNINTFSNYIISSDSITNDIKFSDDKIISDYFLKIKVL